ncbi:3D domain-containing protein [Candidatus Saganbacteria bacterium]|nr:3D domain-containing protein [Candidatus Saganbacteria bacterium]
MLLNKYKVIGRGQVLATAYNSQVGQTDDTPWVTASGTRCREGVIAANHLPIGTKVVIEGFGNQIFTVEDRMNKRYNRRIDIWMRYRHEALKFGVRKIKYHVLATA